LTPLGHGRQHSRVILVFSILFTVHLFTSILFQ
jgi:hypothetical protein